jgi:hypothetical protein
MQGRGRNTVLETQGKRYSQGKRGGDRGKDKREIEGKNPKERYTEREIRRDGGQFYNEL